MGFVLGWMALRRPWRGQIVAFRQCQNQQGIDNLQVLRQLPRAHGPIPKICGRVATGGASPQLELGRDDTGIGSLPRRQAPPCRDTASAARGAAGVSSTC